MNRVNFLSVLLELCDTKDEAQRIYDDSQIVVDQNGCASRNAIMKELNIYFCPNDEIKKMESLANTMDCVNDRMLRGRLEAEIYNTLRNIQDQQDQPIHVSDRIGYEVSQDELFEIGNIASQYYFEKYDRHPPKYAKKIGDKVILVNLYTLETAPDTLDRAIEEVLKE